MPSLRVSPRGLRLMRVTAGSSVDQPQLLLLTVFLRQFGWRRDAVTAIAVCVFFFSPALRPPYVVSLVCLATNAPESSVVTNSYHYHQAVEVPRKSSIHNHDCGCSRLAHGMSGWTDSGRGWCPPLLVAIVPGARGVAGCGKGTAASPHMFWPPPMQVHCCC